MKTEKNGKNKNEKKDLIPLKIIKLVGGVTIFIGVSAILKNIFKQYTPKQANKLTKMCITVGSFFLSSIVVDMAVDKFEADVDNIWTAVNKILYNTEEETEPFEDVTTQWYDSRGVVVMESKESPVIE